MRFLSLFIFLTPVLFAQDGAALYKEKCAVCHDAPQAHVPALSTIKAMSGEAIYATLTTGLMKTQAAGLTTPQLIAVITYIAPTGGKPAPVSIAPTCPGNPAFHVTTGSPQWNGWSASLTNSRFEDAASARLKASDIPKLKVKWAFNLGDVTLARAQPAVIGGSVFITTASGTLYSLDEKTGCTHWGFQAGGAIRSGATVGEVNGVPAVFFSDAGATLFAINAQTGTLLWKNRVVDHYASIATSGPRFYKGVLYQGISSFEETLGGDPKFECCTFRGSVVAVDAASGKKLWQTFTIPEAAKQTQKNAAGTHQWGPSGAGVWSTPTIDEQLGLLYVATGDNYSDPVTDTSDAIMAMDLKTGDLRWSRQMTANDAYNNGCGAPPKTNCPKESGPDYDFGQPPMLVSLGGGKRALVIAQKSGMVHALDPDQKGAILWQTRGGPGGALGGSQWGSATDGKNIYVAISDVGINFAADPKSPQGYSITLDPNKGGGLHALDLKTGKVVWSAKPVPCAPQRTDCSPAQSAAVTAIPGVVSSGSLDGHLRAYSTATGGVLWDENTEREFATVNGKPAHGGSMDAAGPAIVDGMVFVNSGYGQWGGMPGNAFLAFSIDGK